MTKLSAEEIFYILAALLGVALLAGGFIVFIAMCFSRGSLC